MNRRDLDNRQERAAALGDLEALLFAAARPLSLPEIARWLYLEEPQASELVGLLDQELSRPERGLQLREAGAKWQLETRADREDVVAGLRAERGARPLTEQALETLAVVALRQPVTTEEVTAIRGAESYGTIVTPCERRAPEIVGETHLPGSYAGWHLSNLRPKPRTGKRADSSCFCRAQCRKKRSIRVIRPGNILWDPHGGAVGKPCATRVLRWHHKANANRLLAAEMLPDLAQYRLLKGTSEVVDDGSIHAAIHQAERVGWADEAIKLADQGLEANIVDVNAIYSGECCLPLVTKFRVGINQKHFHLRCP